MVPITKKKIRAEYMVEYAAMDKPELLDHLNRLHSLLEEWDTIYGVRPNHKPKTSQELIRLLVHFEKSVIDNGFAVDRSTFMEKNRAVAEELLEQVGYEDSVAFLDWFWFFREKDKWWRKISYVDRLGTIKKCLNDFLLIHQKKNKLAKTPSVDYDA